MSDENSVEYDIDVGPGETDETADISDDDRVPISEIQDQTDVILTSFFDTANSMETWYPKLEQLDVPVPQTTLIELEGGSDSYLGMSKSEIAPVFMSEDPDMKMGLVGRPEQSPIEIQELIEDEYDEDSVFIRSFFKSARHLDHEAQAITDPEPHIIERTLGTLIDDHIMQRTPTGGGVAIREFIDLDFMPDSERTHHPEVRFFVGDGEVKYHWPRMSKESFKKATGDLEFYHEQTEFIEDNIDQLQTYAERVASEFAPHGWSVDFVMDTNGDWYCTDMAVDALYWNERNGEWHNMSEHESGSEYNLAETVGSDLPPPESPPNGFPAWRNPTIEPDPQMPDFPALDQ